MKLCEIVVLMGASKNLTGDPFRTSGGHFEFGQKCKQTAVSQEVSMVNKFCFMFCASHEVPKLLGDKKF